VLERRLRLRRARAARRRRPADAARACGRACPTGYVTHGKPALLHREVGFTGKAIAERITAAVGAGSERPADAG
jgi:hypothetical protein